METQVTKQPTTAVAEAKAPLLVEQKYELKVNEKKGMYHPLPVKIRVDKGQIGSEFTSINGHPTSSIIRGLSTDQERYFSPKLINKNVKDQNYDEAMTIYWAEFKLEIPKQGVQLDASYIVQHVKVDGEQTEMEVPTNLMDYIKANFAKQSNRVAFTADQKSSSDLYDFIMTDSSIVKQEATSLFKLKLEVQKKFVELMGNVTTSDHSKVDWLLDVLKEPEEVFYNSSYEEKCKKLDELKDSKTKEFLAAYADKDLEDKSLLYRLEQAMIVIVEGKARFFGDELLGSTEAETLLFLKDQTKSGIKAKMKAQLSEVTRKKM